MRTVQQVLDTKGRDVWQIEAGGTVLEALKRMAEKGVGALVVTDGDALVGIISERDYARKVMPEETPSHKMLVKEIMTPLESYVAPTQSVEECMAIMTEKRVRHLPVLEGGQLAGIVSIGDLVKSIIDEQQSTIEQLEDYIKGY